MPRLVGVQLKDTNKLKYMTSCAMNISAWPRSPAQIADDNVVATALFKLAITAVGHAAARMMTFDAPPILFIGLTDDDEERSGECLARLRQQWSALEKLEAVIHDNEKAARFHESLLWPWEHWTREMFLALYERDFVDCPPWMRAELLQYSKAHFSTLLVENMANACRRAAKQSESGKFCCKSVWHSCTFGNAVCAEFDRPTSEPSVAAKNMRKCLPKRMFKFEQQKCSISSDQLRGLTEGVARYPIAGPETVKTVGLATRLMVETGGSWDRIKHAWKSLILTPGTLVSHKSKGGVFLVLTTSRHGFVAWRCIVVNRGADKWVDFGCKNDHNLTFDWVEDPRDWRVAMIKIATPSETEHESARKSSSLQAMWASKGHTVLHEAALRGFTALTVQDMSTLFSELLVPYSGRKPTSEIGLATALMQHIVPGIRESEVKKALFARGRSVTPATLASTEASLMKHASMMVTVAEELEDEDMLDEIRRMKERALAEQRRVDKKTQELSGNKPADAASCSSRSRSSVDGGALAGGIDPAVALTRMPLADTSVARKDAGYSQEEARLWAPPGCRLTKECKWHFRWRAEASYLGGIKSKSFGPAGLSDYGAMVWVLTLAWDARRRVHGDACPWKFVAE